jgi:drug/metabolite transporter (DMT)-like permease
MTTAVFLLVLLGAALHASWNAVIKRATDTLRGSVVVAIMASGLAAAGLPFVEAPAPASWPFAATSVALQGLYWVGVAESYRIGDMSRVYPLMRGTAPLIVASLSITLFGDPLSPIAWAGVLTVSAGLLALSLAGPGRGEGRALATALATAVVIAGYTIVDGIGVRRSGSPIGYTLWIFVLTSPALVAWTLWRRPAGVLRFERRDLVLGLFGGFATLASYGIALWAMTRAPIAVVASLRETSILFGTAIAALVLRERVDGRRIAAVVVIAAGAALLRAA